MRRGPAIIIATSIVCLLGIGVRAQEAAPDGGSKPPITQVAGNWTGLTSVDDSGSGNCDQCAMSLILSQNEKKIGGTFSISTADENPAGTVSGKITNSSLTLTLRATGGSKHNCKATLNANVSGDNMSGTWLVKAGPHCKGMGVFKLAKQ